MPLVHCPGFCKGSLPAVWCGSTTLSIRQARASHGYTFAASLLLMLAWIGGIFIVGGAAHCWIPQLRSVAGLYLGYRQDLIGSGSHIDGPGAVAYGLAVADDRLGVTCWMYNAVSVVVFHFSWSCDGNLLLGCVPVCASHFASLLVCRVRNAS